MGFETVTIKNHYEKMRSGLVVNGITVNGRFEPIETPLEVPAMEFNQDEREGLPSMPDRSNVLPLPNLGGETVYPDGPLEVPRMEFEKKPNYRAKGEVAGQEDDVLPVPRLRFDE